ncbi:uncharacterized protein A1O9_09901 [Exophiala aquamarina CBS 119918]|uniref:Zn(2)-C6 fungal-type domain-containing protein n=1 Tax=Exophiala aquamarina CBS 119918 TaxID=1182545 RepID=A0A072P2M7_9EURO|nr:uncharacterized protein A1O9_09901 [Exophiala aquamarina CBS 119918]KEF54106.1 hypothetical protein A1O9_09901 [Exophiala aquamarina CBS 119918]
MDHDFFAKPFPRTQLPPRLKRSAKCCQSCRQSHARCDGGEPACTQCRKRQVVCPGYQAPSGRRQPSKFRIIEYDGKRKEHRRKSPSQDQTKEEGLRPTQTYRHAHHRQQKFDQTSPKIIELSPRSCAADVYDHFTSPEGSFTSPCESVSSSTLEKVMCWVNTSPPDHEGLARGSDAQDATIDDSLPYGALARRCTIQIPENTFISSERDLLGRLLRNCYVTSVGPIMTITNEESNPFIESMSCFALQSDAVSYTLMSIAAMYLNYSDASDDALNCAWHFRTTAIVHLRKELQARTFEISTLAGIVMLAITESWFEPSKNGLDHMKAGIWLLKLHQHHGCNVPKFIVNALCWMVALVGFVADCQSLPLEIFGLDFGKGIEWDERPVSYGQNDLQQSDLATTPSIDPLLGTWSTLMPYVGMVGVAVRALRTRGLSEQLLDSAMSVETKLMQWEIESRASSSGLEARGPEFQGQHAESFLANPQPIGSCATYCDIMAHAYCQSALLTLYTAFPNLLKARLSLLRDNYSIREYLHHTAASIVDALHLIPQESSIWHVSSFPILAAGSSLALDVPAKRQYLLGCLQTLKNRNKINLVDVLSNTLQLVWEKQDSPDGPVTWLEVFDELGIQMLFN